MVAGSRALLEGTANFTVTDIIKLVAKVAFRDYADQLAYTTEDELVARLIDLAPLLKVPTTQRVNHLFHEVLSSVEGIRVMAVDGALTKEAQLAMDAAANDVVYQYDATRESA